MLDIFYETQMKASVYASKCIWGGETWIKKFKISNLINKIFGFIKYICLLYIWHYSENMGLGDHYRKKGNFNDPHWPLK